MVWAGGLGLNGCRMAGRLRSKAWREAKTDAGSRSRKTLNGHIVNRLKVILRYGERPFRESPAGSVRIGNLRQMVKCGLEKSPVAALE
jgi:hypothetical protein